MRRHDYCFTIFAALFLLGGVYQFIRAALPLPPDVPCDCSKCGGGIQGGRRLASNNSQNITTRDVYDFLDTERSKGALDTLTTMALQARQVVHIGKVSR